MLICCISTGLRKAAGIVISTGTVLAYCASVSAASVNAEFTAEDYLSAQAGFTLTIDAALAADERLAIFLGDTDLSQLFIIGADGAYHYPAQTLPLPAGQHELIVYRVSATDWQELDRLPLNVLTPMGLRHAELTPTLEVALNTQLSGRTRDDAPPLPRTTFQDLELRGGVNGVHQGEGWEVRSNANASGVSHRQQALRFFERPDNAPKLDLESYLIEAERGAVNLSLGHVVFGQNPLLMSGVANRGLTAHYAPNPWLDLGLGLMNATSIVGYDNIVGLNRLDDHRMAAGTLGVNLLADRPGELRAELTYFDGRVQDDTNFNFGEVADVEQNRGLGLQLSGLSASGRWRGNASYARSRFNNPQDLSLALDSFEVVEIKPSTDTAYALELSYAVLQQQPVFGEQLMNLSLNAGHSYADALYRSMGAFVEANQKLYRISADANIGWIDAQLGYSWRQDNVDDLPSVLTTRSRGLNAMVNVPLTRPFSEYSIAVWLPDVTYSLDRVHQEAVNEPDPLLSGFDDPSQLPDQVARMDALDFSWNHSRWNALYRLAHSDEDNRQPGREQADFNTLENRLQFGLQATDTVNVNWGVGRNRTADREQQAVRYTTDYSVGLNWHITDEWSTDTQLTLIREHTDDSNSRFLTGSAQVNYRFEISNAGHTLPGHWYLRYSHDRQRTRDQLFDFDSSALTSTLQSGLSFSF